jgi:hypothetical protein
MIDSITIFKKLQGRVRKDFVAFDSVVVFGRATRWSGSGLRSHGLKEKTEISLPLNRQITYILYRSCDEYFRFRRFEE